MLSINTNLSSLIAQNSLKDSTSILNQAVERMTTGYKINHAKDNAANYSISTNMQTQIQSYDVASDNVTMGMDLVTTASDIISTMQSHANRLQSLSIQARNGTYGAQSMAAINSEAAAIMAEINRLYSTAEYNDIKLFDSSKYVLPEHLQHKKNDFIETPDLEDVEGFTIKTLSDAFAQGMFDTSIKYSISNADELKKFAKMVNDGVDTTGVHFFLIDNIDVGEIDEFTCIGAFSNTSFKGIFNGNGFTINNLKKTLFYYNQGCIKNLGLISVNIITTDMGAGLAHYNNGDINNCFVTGDIKGRNHCGAIVSDNYKNISNSYADVNILSNANVVGGLVAYNYGQINTCYSKGNITGNLLTGGLVGELRNGSIIDSNSYCNVKSSKGGGLIGGISKSKINFSDFDINNSYTILNSMPKIGGAYIYDAASYSFSQVDYDLSLLESDIKILYKDLLTISLQVGICNDLTSSLNLITNFDFDLSAIGSDISSDSALACINDFLTLLSEKSTMLGAVENRLNSALDSITVNIENLTSSLSTIRDADIAEVSSTYIQQQILQQAASTLLATANQSPSIALQLI